MKKHRPSKYELEKGSIVMNSCFNLVHKLGSGNFGDVFLITKNSLIIEEQFNHLPDQASIKIEKELGEEENMQLNNEAYVLRILNSSKDVDGFPKLYYEGTQGGNHFIVMSLLGPNLRTLIGICGGKFSLKTSLLLIFQVFERLEYIHSKGYIYCDIKPENFLMGIQENSHILHIIDFGLCKKYKSPETGLHQTYKENKKLNGTLRYASISSQFGVTQSRRDDLQSACYMLVYFLKGKLPWEGYQKSFGETKENWILMKKLKSSASELCQGFPNEIVNVITYCQQLQFYEDPDYNFILAELKELYVRYGYKFDYQYDWTDFTEIMEDDKGPTYISIFPNEEKLH